MWLKHSDNTTILWCVGPDEDNLQQEFKLVNGVFLCPFTRVPEQYMAAADIFCMPSYREGFGTAVIEAAACGIPSIGSNIYGLCDAIVNGSTGILVPVKSHLELKIAIKQLAKSYTVAPSIFTIRCSSFFFTKAILSFVITSSYNFNTVFYYYRKVVEYDNKVFP